MAMVCPICSKRYEQQLRCPECAVNLQYEVEGKVEGLAGLPPHWSRTPWGRIVLGIVLGQGLFYGVYELLLAGQDLWGSIPGLLTIQVLQMVAVGAGSMLVGAGQRNAIAYGSIVGTINGIVYLIIQTFWGVTGEQLTAVSYYSQPILYTAFGALGGFLGSMIWRPPAVLAPARRFLVPPKAPRRIFSFPTLKTWQIHWLRVISGIAIAVGGVCWAELILAIVLEFHKGPEDTGLLQQQVMTLEIMALSIFLGGAFAGANTWNGLVQGIVVGVASTLLLLLMRFWPSHLVIADSLPLRIAATMILSIAGGWFGSRLLPPIIREVPQDAQHYRPMPV